MKKLFIIFAILCLAAPAMAADWDFYGSARMTTFYTAADSDVEGIDTVNRTQWGQQGNARIGAKVKVNDQISGAFEYGEAVNLRKLYGTYTFGGGSELLLGQTYPPTSSRFYSNSVYDGDGDLDGIGQFYTGRRAMIQWKTGGFKVALVEPTYPKDNAGAGYVVDLIIPKIEAAYKFKGDTFFLDVFGAYHSYGQDYATGNDPDIQSYAAGIGGGMNFGVFFFNLGGHMGQNVGNYGAYAPNLAGARAINTFAGLDANQETIDNKDFGALAVVGMNVSDKWSIEAGYGYESCELDTDGADAETVWQAYVNATINIVPGFFIVPEVGYASYDYDNGGGPIDPNPNLLYVGAKWQINF